MIIKCCGLNPTRDVQVCLDLKVDFLGFIFYEKSPRNIKISDLDILNDYNRKNALFTAVTVDADNQMIDQISSKNIQCLQLHGSETNERIEEIKQKYKKKIITALSIKDEVDVQKYHLFYEITDIYLFDSKGYEKSMAFDHSLIEKIKINKPVMIAGNIQVNDNLENYKKIADIIDISGGLETSGVKDKSKIDIFLNKVEHIQNET